jgi:hypothetical protein
LLSVAEQLKVPLTTIARQSELAQLTGDYEATTQSMQLQAGVALTLVDNYLLGLQLLQQESLELEPVSVSSALIDVVHALQALARQHSVELDVKIGGKYEPVMAHHQGLRAALLSLGYSLIAAAPGQDGPRKKHVTLAAHRSNGGIVAGMYGAYDSLTTASWRTAMQLCGTSSQPLAKLTADSGAGVFVADALARAMESELRVARHASETGLALTLLPSRQMTFI